MLFQWSHVAFITYLLSLQPPLWHHDRDFVSRATSHRNSGVRVRASLPIVDRKNEPYSFSRLRVLRAPHFPFGACFESLTAADVAVGCSPVKSRHTSRSRQKLYRPFHWSSLLRLYSPWHTTPSYIVAFRISSDSTGIVLAMSLSPCAPDH